MAGYAAVTLGSATHVYATQPTCAQDPNNPRWYADAESGSGQLLGDGANTTTWTNWSAPYPYGFSDEAQWSIYTNDPSNALEGGFFTGAGNNVAWTNGMMPYSTINNGRSEYDTGQYLPTATNIWMATISASSGQPAYVQVGSVVWSPGNYAVSLPQQTYAQGETNTTSAWMGGGTGEPFQEYYAGTDRNWYLWGYLGGCDDSPYWWAWISNSQWSNGGY